MDFYDLDLNDDVLDALDAMNFTTCTPIQEHTIPPLLEGWTKLVEVMEFQ